MQHTVCVSRREVSTQTSQKKHVAESAACIKVEQQIEGGEELPLSWYLQELLTLVERIDRVQDNLIIKLIEHDDCFEKVERYMATQGDVDLILHRQDTAIHLIEASHLFQSKTERWMKRIEGLIRTQSLHLKKMQE